MRLIFLRSGYSSTFFGCKKADTVVVGWRKQSSNMRLEKELSMFLGIFRGVGVRIDHWGSPWTWRERNWTEPVGLKLTRRKLEGKLEAILEEPSLKLRQKTKRAQAAQR